MRAGISRQSWNVVKCFLSRDYTRSSFLAVFSFSSHNPEPVYNETLFFSFFQKMHLDGALPGLMWWWVYFLKGGEDLERVELAKRAAVVCGTTIVIH